MSGITFSKSFSAIVLGCIALADIILADCPVTLSGGHNHSVATKADGTVWCWGGNSQGQLGDNTTSSSNVPIQTFAPSGPGFLQNIIQISTSSNASLALRQDGTAWAWGDNGSGQLGDGTTIQSNIPVQVSGLTGLIQVAGAADGDSGYALKSDGTVWAWGWNAFGQLGDNTTTQRTSPVQVLGLTNIVQIAGGYVTGYALKNDGTVYAWGSNTEGELGNNNIGVDSHTAVQVVSSSGSGTLTGIVSIIAGVSNAYAIKNDGSVYAWGQGGANGDATNTNRPYPVQVLGLNGVGTLSNVKMLSAGEYYFLVLLNDGSILACGQNNNGKLGDGTTTDSNVLIQSVAGNDWASVDASGGFHSLASKTDGTVWAWGRNTSGQLGDGTNSNSFTAVQTLNMVIGICTGAIEPPTNLTGKVTKNSFATQTNVINKLSWTASTDPTVIGYRVYIGQYLVADLLASSPLTVTFNNCSEKGTTYILVAYNSSGDESAPLTITLK